MTYHHPNATAGLGEFPPAIGDEMGIDPRAYNTSGIENGRLVPTVWAQRALNAAGIRTIVDGLAGPNTLTNMRSYWSRMTSLRGPEPALQTGHPSWVFMSTGMEANLSLLRRVADPAGSTVAANSWTTPPSSGGRTSTPSGTTLDTSSGTSTTKPPVSQPTSTPILPSGTMSADPVPWIVGGTVAAAGLGFIVFAAARRRKKAPTANRRKRR